MGNKIARTTQASATEYYLHDLPSSYNLVLKEVLGRGRFLKSIQCKHDEGLVIVKVYFKRGDQIDLRDYERRLFRIREIFRSLDHPHVWPFQFWLETDKAAYLLRQYFFNNLHDRLSTRPFLSLVEKKWLAFQLLYAAKQSHDHGICHGDIKCENVLVTSWNWVYLADFASFKPTYIPDDDPSDFSFFFDTGGRRLCYLAPERFYEHASDMPVAPDAPLKPSMDIFSVGCVIAELFLEGQPLFELSQLLAYRRGQYDPSLNLEKIPDPGLRKMILHMIQLDPESRLSAEGYLQMPEFGGSGRDSGAGICHNPTTIPPNITPEEAAWLKSYYPEAKDEGESERKKHAIAVAAATAAAADAAVAAAHAAVEVVRLTSRGRKQSSINNNLFVGEGGFDGIASWAAVRIQTNFRAYLARKALRALKGLVKIQALVRGYLVRKQATATLHGMQALIRAQATIRSKRVLIGSHQPDHDSPTWARPSMVDAFGAPSSAAQSRRLSASFEARTLNPPIDHDTPKVVEVDIGHPGSRSARKGPGTRTSFSELGDDPSSYQILPPQFQFDHFHSHPQLAPARISIPNHSHQCCHHFNNSEWGLTEECRSTTSQNTPRFSSCGAEPVGPTPPLTPTRAGSGAAIFHHGGWGRQQLYYYNYPSYMAKTMSFKAKVRSHSAPKQRPEGTVNGNCMSSNSNIKKRMTLSEMMDARNSLSGVRMQRSCSQVQEAINFKNAVMGKLGRSPF